MFIDGGVWQFQAQGAFFSGIQADAAVTTAESPGGDRGVGGVILVLRGGIAAPAAAGEMHGQAQLVVWGEVFDIDGEEARLGKVPCRLLRGW